MTPTKTNRSPRWLSALFAATVIAAAWLAVSGTARADERTWTVKEVTGTARIQHGGAGWAALKVGDSVQPGSKVETTADARLALARPGDSIDVAGNSRFEVPSAVDPKAKAPAHILQTVGTLLFKITTRPDHPFGVKTPYLAAVIKGTVFTVSVKGSESELHVTKGAVEVTSVITNQVVMVRPGMTAAIDGAKGGQMQVIGERRGDNGKTGGSRDTAAANAKVKTAAADAATQVIPHSVGPQRINVFQSSGGLVRDLQNGPGKGQGQGRGPEAGNGKAVGHGNDIGNGNAVGNTIASVGSSTTR